MIFRSLALSSTLAVAAFAQANPAFSCGSPQTCAMYYGARIAPPMINYGMGQLGSPGAAHATKDYIYRQAPRAYDYMGGTFRYETTPMYVQPRPYRQPPSPFYFSPY